MVLFLLWFQRSNRKSFSSSACTASRGPRPQKPQDACCGRWRNDAMRRLCTLLLSLGLPLIAPAQTRTVRIGVLGLFHTQQLTLAADRTGELVVSAADQRIFLRAGSECSLLHIWSSGTNLLLSCGNKEICTTQ